MVLAEWSFLVIIWLQNGACGFDDVRVDLLNSFIDAFTVNIGETRVCRSDMKDISGFPRDGSYEILLNTFGHNCTHIYGNLILTDLYISNDGSDPDLNFLRSIREITGYLIIMHSNVAAIPLSNLRVIRAQNGGYQIRPNAKPAALIVRQNYKNGYPLRHIDLRNLRSIVQGSVYVYDNPGLCQWPDQIDWSELFEHPTEQHVFRSDDSSENGVDLVINRTFNSFYFNEIPPLSLCGSKKCAQSCVPVNGNRYCWGSAHADCQHHVSCDQLVCDRCFIQGNHTGCCHEQCLGGCFGPLPTQCEVCREFNNSGTCVSHCPHPLYSQGGSGSELKYQLGNLCVSECPAGFLIEHTACVTHCTYPGMHIVGRTCQLCDGPCPKTCELEQVRSKNGIMVQLIGAPALRSLSGCTRLNGNLVLSTESFYPSTTVPDHEPITAVSQLWALHSLREVTGYVYMDLGFFGPALKNLSFLENLVKVSGVFSLSQASVMIMNSMAREPGLRSLREVPHGQVVFHNNSHMCYLETLPWIPTEDYLYDGDQDLRIIVKLGADPAQCYRSGARCHSDCDLHGCWGPRPDQCVRCRHLRAGPHLCVPTCDALPGYRLEPIVMNASLADVWPQFARRWQEDARFRESVHTGPGQPDSAHVCIPCHPECRQSCSGPAADECIGGCKTAWYNGFCVPECPRDTYLTQNKEFANRVIHIVIHVRPVSRLSVPVPHPVPVLEDATNVRNFYFYPLLSEITRQGKTQVLLQSHTINNICATFSSAETETFHVTCLRGDCPVGTYLSTELIHPSTNTSLSVQLSHMAETRTHMVPVCRPCHPLCKQCSAYSLVRSNSKQLGCIECRGWWFRDTCVEQCPTLILSSHFNVSSHWSHSFEVDTYMILETNITTTAAEESASNQLSVDHPTTTATGHASADTWVRFRGGHCLACHPECQSGCWNAGINHCYRCSHFRIHFALLSASTVVNKTDAKTFTSKWIGLEDHDATSGKVQFICVSQCPPELPYHVKHPSTDEQICHTRPRLSSAQREQLLLEESSVSGVDQIARVKNLTNSSLLWISGLLLLLTAFILCCCCCLRLRVRAWSKQRRGQQQLRQQHPVRSFGARLGLKLAAALRRKTMAGTFEQMIPWHDETIECQTFISQSNGQTKRETTCTSTSSCSHAVMASVYHKHCLPLLGVCLSQTRKCLVSAYVINGSLDRYLRVHEPDLPEILLLDWASQIADGMAYLQSRGIIHRSWARWFLMMLSLLRRCLIRFSIYSTHTRTGVTIWEIFTFGEKPYDQIETAQVKTHILSGGRLPQPDICTLELYQVMIRCWNDDPEERPNFNELYEMFANFVQQPNLYLHSRTTSSIATGYPEHSSGGDTRSRTTLYPSFHLPNDRSNGVSSNQVPSPNVQASLASNSTYGSGNQLNGAQSTRHFDPRRRMRGSLLQSVMISPNGRLPRYQAQKRRSTCVPSEHTLSTSLSRTSSTIGDPWNQNNPAHHSHPILAETNGPQLNNPINRRFGLPTGTTALSHAIHPFHAGLLLSTDSRTSSGQPLLSSDQDSSLSQLVLSNLGYNSSESRSSMIAPNASSRTTEVEQQGPSEPTVPQSESGTELRACSTRTINSSDTTAMLNNMPTNFEIEAAAGYVWPQWPAVFSQTATADVTEEGADPEQEHVRSLSPPQQFGVNGDMDDNFPFLNRQLWLRRSARQRQYYLRQWQIHRSAMGMALPELATEEAIAENENTRSPTEDSEAEPGSTTFGPVPDMNESDVEDPTERYCLDPTSSPGTLER
ncbi:Melanoma receptor tyrosine-protein kinase [Fasciola gigantica]|uniref:receptor protein-tyrosine kinase n=1 Tax=Fasciola gigantica TaxID=46835 RepID=A0A504YU93_FASGI|nr:Melanoma receptor tyrosine-protein kinase [Fasciola gigantica]